MTSAIDARRSTPNGPFAATAEKYNMECASGKVTISNFPYDEVMSLPGYPLRLTPALAATDVSRELARCLAKYAEIENDPFCYSQRYIAWYLWMQASRKMLAWHKILQVVRAARKQDRQKPIAHFFGYRNLIKTMGKAPDMTLIKLVRYVSQEGICTGCENEFPFDELTLDHIQPRSANGALELTNVQLMCQPCNNFKGSNCSR